MSHKGKTYRKQARKMIFDVYNFMKDDAAANNIKITVKVLEQKTADATKASLSTVRRIMKDARDNNCSADNFVTPGKKRARQNTVSNFTLLELGKIKQIIHNFHVTENEMLTMDKLTRKLANTMGYKGSENSLRRTLMKLGFRWKKLEGGRRLLIEKSDIRLQRIEYLEKLKSYRHEGKNIVYTHLAFISNQATSLKKPMIKFNMGIFSASTDSVIIPNSILVFSTSKTDYEDHFYIKYELWIKEHLIPNLPEKSVVIISREKYHYKVCEAIPTSCAKKSETITWLEKKDIDFEHDWLKPKLYDLVKMYKAKNNYFLIDKLLSEHNHNILWIPICHPDLNPIEISYDDIKTHIKTTEMQFNILNITMAVKQKVEAMADDFKTICRKVKFIEQAYSKSDFVIDMLTEEFKFYAGESSDQDDDEDDEEEDDDEPEDSDEEVKVKKERLE